MSANTRGVVQCQEIMTYTALLSHSDTPNGAVQFIALLLQFWAVVTSNLGRNTEYIALNFFLVLLSPSRTLPGLYLKFGHIQTISQHYQFFNHLSLLTNYLINQPTNYLTN